jgi:hypothetical protein
MKRLSAFVIAAAFAAPAHALLGIGDITFDPTTYGEVAKQYEQMVKMYNTAKDQLDGLVKIEKTIKDAQQAYETLASGDLKNSITGLTSGGMNVKSAADLRAELANMESKGGQSASYVAYQMSLIKQLDDLTKLQKASATNAQQATGKTNAATSSAITAQSTSTLAALAAAEEQRRVQQDYQNQKNAKALVDNMKDSTKIYDAIGK